MDNIKNAELPELSIWYMWKTNKFSYDYDR
jgi:hypothetical protein